MKNRNNISLIALLVLFFIAQTSCDDMFEPAIDNHKDESELVDMPIWAVGLLGHVYIGNPLDTWQITDVATDNAVTNDRASGLRAMATGSWRANNNPLNRWQNLRSAWNYVNIFLDVADDVEWAADPLVDLMFNDRFKGEAYGLRALLMYHLLLNHAGPGPDGQLLGIPIVTEPENIDSEFNLPRNTFQECIDFLIADAERAMSLLPSLYGDVTDNNNVPEKYREMGVIATVYTRVFGNHSRNRMSGRIAKAIRAQAALLAASPAYSSGSDITWADAANFMADVLGELGSNPIAQIAPDGHRWYADNSAIGNLNEGNNPREILWRSNRANNVDLEREHFPPTLFGTGRVNPSQNFVDAFPMLNGYPIGHSESNYDPNNPYANRDPRLAAYVVLNGSTLGPQSVTVNTAADGPDFNALNRDGNSTRTGYYLRKLLNPAANPNPNSETPGHRYRAFMRYTEFFLGYAEAANEAWGPTGTGAHGYSAYDVVRAIRQRAGIGVNGNDPYLESVMNDTDAMRELIRNERRLELSFENFRFWDLRRWKVDLNEPVMGMRIQGGNYTEIEVEDRAYQDYMYYGPVPFSEVIKFDNLLQNQGW
ncbi:RagB/SusD family nutrient uptake outer membrane protein [Natronoflexus pectinivorans]|uniref:Putative outer membrane starch-binding protein n=1 Tax=Natronoflexus pectinivorans TaxID=682526 RepID=A0A4R2GNT8_9BACT|nr:RagB/SusD family nutrient uptake outer membrane protein [Natronoflexus pectinivorans]TCO10697.1 putative outer membrane starch-binding protein [Natronoflexus pectinivorans]